MTMLMRFYPKWDEVDSSEHVLLTSNGKDETAKTVTVEYVYEYRLRAAGKRNDTGQK